MFNQIKRTLKNWATENRTLAYVIAGAIGLPLALAIIGAVFVLITWMLSFIFGTAIAMLIIFFALLGALIGFMIANTREKEHSDYY